MTKTQIVSNIAIRAIEAGKFTVRLTYLDGRKEGSLVTEKKLREVINDIKIK